MATHKLKPPEDPPEEHPIPSTTISTPHPPSPKHIPKSKRNAFTELMTHPPKRIRTPPPSTPPTDPALTTRTLGRAGLGAYIIAPQSFPPDRVIYHNDSFVVINDLFPKSSIHLLILPRDPAKQLLHPFEAFDDDPKFLAEVRAEVAKVRELAAKELRRRFGQFSIKEREKRAWEEAENERETAETGKSLGGQSAGTVDKAPPPGRDYSADIIAGVHAVPSMTHLHIHVLSRDRYSPCLKHRKHYNSFATDFFVPLEAFPLGKEDVRRWPGREDYLGRGFRCWRCGRGFGKGFKALKEHLEVEFEGWRAE